MALAGLNLVLRRYGEGRADRFQTRCRRGD